MAAALLEDRARGRIVVHSAGSAPVTDLNPAVVQALGELGIDITDRAPKAMTEEVARGVDVVVTMGCGDTCPVYPGKRYLDWDLPDPAGLALEDVRPIRDEIGRRVKALADELLAQEGRGR